MASDSVDSVFSVDDGLTTRRSCSSEFPVVRPNQELVIGEEGTSLPIDPSSISRLNIERGNHFAAAISFKYLSGTVNDHSKWVQHELASAAAEQTLRKAKILPSVLISGLCNVNKDQALLRYLVRRWSKETHTFVTSWGEFTPTLEDTVNLMGFPIVGSIDPSNIQISMEDVDKLGNLKEAKGVRFALWVKHFYGVTEEDGDFTKGDGHDSRCRLAALLSLWLSKFVFPDGKDVIQERVFPLALLLSRGVAFPLAPMFLGNLYESLDLLTIQEKKGGSDKTIDSGVSTVFLQMFMWERLKSLPINPTSLASFKKKELPDFGIGKLPLMYRWFRKSNTMSSSSLLACLDDEESFEFRPYIRLADEVLLRPLCDGCKDPVGIVLEPVKESDAHLDIYLTVNHGFLPTLGEKSNISFVSYSPDRVRRQFGLDQGISFDRGQNETYKSCDLYHGKMDCLDDDAFVTLAGKERKGGKSHGFHTYWLSVLHGFDDYVKSGLPHSKLDPPRLACIVGSGETSSIASGKSKKRKHRPKANKNPSHKRAVVREQEGTRFSNPNSNTPGKRTLYPREPQRVTCSSNEEDQSSSSGGHESSSEEEEPRVPLHHSSKEKAVRHDHGTSSGRSQVTLVHEEKGSEIDDRAIPPLNTALLEKERGHDFGAVGGAPLSVSPTHPRSGPRFPAKKIEDVPPSILAYVQHCAELENGPKMLDNMECLYPPTYSVERRLSFRGMNVCPEVIAPLTLFFEKYGDMSQLDCLKHCMCDTKSMLFEKLGLVLYNMDKTPPAELTLDLLLSWRDVVRELMCLNIPVRFLLDHLQKLLRVSYFLGTKLSVEILYQIGAMRVLEQSVEDVRKKIRVEQRRLREMLSRSPDFPTEYSEFVVESTSFAGRTGLLDLLDA